jgi:hypothetical protein
MPFAGTGSIERTSSRRHDLLQPTREFFVVRKLGLRANITIELFGGGAVRRQIVGEGEAAAEH